jgi:hypothetical protein
VFEPVIMMGGITMVALMVISSSVTSTFIVRLVTTSRMIIEVMTT